jgi:hypothetical protein
MAGSADENRIENLREMIRSFERIHLELKFERISATRERRAAIDERLEKSATILPLLQRRLDRLRAKL